MMPPKLRGVKVIRYCIAHAIVRWVTFGSFLHQTPNDPDRDAQQSRDEQHRHDRDVYFDVLALEPDVAGESAKPGEAARQHQETSDHDERANGDDDYPSGSGVHETDAPFDVSAVSRRHRARGRSGVRLVRCGRAAGRGSDLTSGD